MNSQARKIIFVGFLLAVVYQLRNFYEINPDGISYIEIAKNYLTGNYWAAINAYWSPAYSFVLIPFLRLTSPLVAAKSLDVFLYVLWLITAYLLARQLLKNEIKASFVVLFLVLSSEVYKQLMIISPDMLFGVYVNILLIYAFKEKSRHTKNYWLVLGLLAGFGYLIKSFFLIFALAYFPIYLLQQKNRRQIFLYFLCGFCIIPGLWIGLISFKYHHVTMGTTAGVSYRGFVMGEGFEFLKTPKPYPKSGTSFWYDPGDFRPLSFNLAKQLTAVFTNLKTTTKFLFVSLHFGLLLFIYYEKNIFRMRKFPYLLLFIVVWIGLYALIFTEGRYLLPLLPLFFILIFTVLNSKNFYFLLLIVQLLFFIKVVHRYFKTNETALTHVRLSTYIKQPCVIMSDWWERGLYVAFLSGCKYYGKYLPEQLNQEIIEGKVNYIISFRNSDTFSGTNLTPVVKLRENNTSVTLFHTSNEK
jgi:hypothetical protein